MVLKGKVKSIDGKEIDIKAETICIHGDNQEAVDFAVIIRKALTEAGVQLKALK